MLWVTLAYAREYMIQHYAYAPVTKSITRELSTYVYIFSKYEIQGHVQPEPIVIYLLSSLAMLFVTGA